jgi:hypothetical protein
MMTEKQAMMPDVIYCLRSTQSWRKNFNVNERDKRAVFAAMEGK